MADYRAAARRAATKYGIDPAIFQRQIAAESGFNPRAGSSAGARGIAQIMPGTAKAWGVNPEDPIASLDAAAKNMAGYIKKYGGWRDALVAYNAGPGRVGGALPGETRAYISKILGGTNPTNAGANPNAANSKAPTVGSAPATPTSVGGGTDQDSALVDSMLAARPKFDGKYKAGGLLAAANERIATGAYGLPSAAAPKSPNAVSSSTSSATPPPSSPSGSPKAGGGYRGTQGLINSLRAIGGQALSVTSAKRNNANPHSGSRSDHDHGNKDAFANDLSNGSAPTKEMDRAAFRIMRSLGFSTYKMGQAINTSQGVKTLKTANGTFRVQVIYRGTGAAFGGNHMNHVHVGAKRIA